jgi:hypothetical protein
LAVSLWKMVGSKILVLIVLAIVLAVVPVLALPGDAFPGNRAF